MIKGDKIKVVGNVGKIKPPTVSYQMVATLASNFVP